jgi:sulfur carrier protein
MKLIINGDQHDLIDSIKTVGELLHHFHLDQKVLIVELNEAILEKLAHTETLLSDGDRIEIVHFVGGG